jgi:hypothetical protein
MGAMRDRLVVKKREEAEAAEKKRQARRSLCSQQHGPSTAHMHGA